VYVRVYITIIITPWPLGHLVPGGYKYGNLALQVEGVSDETLKYGREFCGTSTQECCSGKAQKQLYSKLETRPLVREGATK
jgi:hypothetical protein